MFTPGILTAADAAALNKMRQELDRLRVLLTRTPDDVFPASITSVSSGYHAWTEQAFDTDLVRYTKVGGRTGTTSFSPARMPDGSDLSSLPQNVWLRRSQPATDTVDGMGYEILVGSGGGGLTETDFGGGSGPGSISCPASGTYSVGTGVGTATASTTGKYVVFAHATLNCTLKTTATAISGYFTLAAGGGGVFTIAGGSLTYHLYAAVFHTGDFSEVTFAVMIDVTTAPCDIGIDFNVVSGGGVSDFINIRGETQLIRA